VRRRIVAVALAAIAIALLAYLLFLRGGDSEKAPARPAVATSVIGSGEGAVGVSARGELLVSRPPPPEGSLPELPLSEPPEGGRLSGPVLEQALVLGAAPPPLRPCIAASEIGETGVDVVLRSGIELRFGNASRAGEKWRSAIAVLADPSITALDYVDLHSPNRPAVYGEGHGLPEPEGGPSARCGE
jgi:hypothetical protein